MIAVDERVVQLVVLIGELDGRLVENDALLNAVALCKGACRNIADYYLERHYRDALYYRLAVAELADKVGGNALLLEQGHKVVGHAVVYRTLALDGALLQSVECGRVVLVGDYNLVCLVGRVYALCLALIDKLSLFHRCFSFFVCDL